MDCREAQLLIQTDLDKELQKDKEACLAEHLAVCGACAGEKAFRERLSFSLHDFGQEAVQAPPELCQTVMGRLRQERRAVFTWLPLAWRKTVAAAATILLLAGGYAGVTAGLKIAGTDKTIVTGPAGVNTDSETVAPDNGDILHSGDGNGGTNGGEGDGNPLIAQNGNADAQKDNVDDNNDSLESLTAEPNEGPKVLLSNGMQIVTTTLRASSGDLAADGAKVVAQAAALGAKAQTFSEQDIDKKVLILRITVASDEAHNLIAGIAGLGTVNDRQDESRDITSLYNDTLIKYYDLQGKLCSPLDSSEKQQLESQAVSYKQQLDAWEAEAGKRIIILLLESN